MINLQLYHICKQTKFPTFLWLNTKDEYQVSGKNNSPTQVYSHLQSYQHMGDRQDYHFQASLGYTVRSRPAKATK